MVLIGIIFSWGGGLSGKCQNLQRSLLQLWFLFTWSREDHVAHEENLHDDDILEVHFEGMKINKLIKNEEWCLDFDNVVFSFADIDYIAWNNNIGCSEIEDI